uniref:Uncharacterized protein n=1 Tax=Rhizophora mucronata TaxID=61149 RepID=A0A2P2J2W4_RHIMU
MHLCTISCLIMGEQIGYFTEQGVFNLLQQLFEK